MGITPLPGDYPSAPDRIAEARFLAARMRALVDDHDDSRRGDIVVLLRAYTHVAAFEEELERAGLRPYVVGGRGYWSQQQVEDVRRLLGHDRQPARRRVPARRCLPRPPAQCARTRSGSCGAPPSRGPRSPPVARGGAALRSRRAARRREARELPGEDPRGRRDPASRPLRAPRRAARPRRDWSLSRSCSCER